MKLASRPGESKTTSMISVSSQEKISYARYGSLYLISSPASSATSVVR